MSNAPVIRTPAGSFLFHARGNWTKEQVETREIASSWQAPPEVLALIDDEWAKANQRKEVRLFDGPMCRLESFSASSERLLLMLSQTRYKIFLGTNLTHPDLADHHGRNVLANSVGVSVAVQTADGYLPLGRRNDSVVYYAGRHHPFAGAFEPREQASPFLAARRELCEEAGLKEDDISDLRCIALAEDAVLRQPELIFAATTRLTLDQIQRQMGHEEHHHELLRISADADALGDALHNPTLTPIAAATLLAWGQREYGEQWLVGVLRKMV